ncbi:hypothetical protein [Acinetobacter seifertii]|uniref:hypothetical protein n=1 Tax=Acinetobacter seifertii TaxID=1530123 RepID=UPI001904C522|nr:hypothetical protein [Acinetobacter seifertii]MBJ9425159.1 hypothetical protein [Acinetobacter seifertii]
MSDVLKFSLALMWRVVWLFLPCTEAAFAALDKNPKGAAFLTNEALRQSTANHSDVILTFACIVVLICGTTIGYFFPTPEYGAKPLPKPIKLLISMTCGFLAFVYYIHTEKYITPAVIIWVAGVSFVSPAIIHLVHAAAIKFTGMRLGLNDNDLNKIEKSFEKPDSREG